MLHLHDLNHVQVGFGRGLVDGQDSVDDVGGKLRRQGSVELGGQRRAGNAETQFSVDLLGKLERIEELVAVNTIPDIIPNLIIP